MKKNVYKKSFKKKISQRDANDTSLTIQSFRPNICPRMFKHKSHLEGPNLKFHKP